MQGQKFLFKSLVNTVWKISWPERPGRRLCTAAEISPVDVVPEAPMG